MGVVQRRSLQTIVNEVVAYFTIDQIIEPQPTERFKQKAPEKYERLMKSPQFLIVKVKNSIIVSLMGISVFVDP